MLSLTYRSKMAFQRKTLSKVFELRKPLQRFLLEVESHLVDNFCHEKSAFKLAYLCDIFSLLNESNLSLQEKITTMFQLADKVATFKAKLELWKRRVDEGIYDMFPT